MRENIFVKKPKRQQREMCLAYLKYLDREGKYPVDDSWKAISSFT